MSEKISEMVIEQPIHHGWSFRQVGNEDWLPATVPVCNHTDLLDNQLIDDPFWRLNEVDLQWIDKEDWEYRTALDVDSTLLECDRVTLHFQGLDTYAVEAHRRAMPYCMGTLYWQLNDCWPVASWSSMDSSLRWKAQQYFIKKAFEPLVISPFVKDDVLSLHIVNDHQYEIKGDLRICLIDFEGVKLSEELIPVSVLGNSSYIYFESEISSVLGEYSAQKTLLVSELIVDGIESSRALYYFEKVKELNLPKPNVTYEISATSTGFALLMTTESLAKNLYLTMENEDCFFMDNYFDLLPCDEVTVQLTTEMDLKTLKRVLRLRCLE